MNKRALKAMAVALVAVGLVATVLMVGCGSSTTTQAPATTGTTSTPATTATTVKAATTTTDKAATTTTVKAATTTTVKAADGKALFAQYCVSCHAAPLGVPASDLTKIENILKSGKDGMPGFADRLSAAQITAIATLLTTSN